MSRSRQFTKVSPDVWTSKRFRSVSEPAKLMLLYLMTCSHQNSAGAFRAPLGYVSVDMDWTVDRVAQVLAELVMTGLVSHDDHEEEIFVHGWFLFNPPMNRDHASGTHGQLMKLKSERIRNASLQELDAAIAADPVVSEAVKARNGLTDTNYMKSRKGR